MSAQPDAKVGELQFAPFDQRLFSHPARFAAIIVGVMLFLLAILVLAILGYSVIPEISAVGLVTDALAALLALGTFSLAYATGYMAQSVRRQADSAEKKRRADLLPHLDIRVLWPESSGQPFRSQPIAYDIFPVEIPASGYLTGVIRNLGPGNAMRVNAVAYSWWVPWQQPPREGFGTPVEERTLGPEPIVNDFALKANEEYKFPIMVLLPSAAKAEDATAHPVLRRQLLVAATCQDVEGSPAGVARMGMFLIGPVLPYPNRLLSWKAMDDETALRILSKQMSGIHWMPSEPHPDHTR